jgi:hypothetical protein
MNTPGRPAVYRYGYGFGASYEYTSPIRIGGWPLVHICGGVDPITLQPRVARGVVAIGNIAVGVVAIGGVACGLFTCGGASLGLLLAVGGAAVGGGLSVGGLAIGSIAIGGAAFGLVYAVGGAAFAPAIIDARRCDQAARAFFAGWFNGVPNSCR